ncbi:TetR/AcrR family transcriptional regulator [Nocardia asteroides]|uniref:TetR/AcrR family transcriptional regulator n=1 Tax=Nocardia asteroides TaxID=1824 RepID=UPI001E56CE9C|nr:TetR/AcrR family transcriptional regulator [Nocardia asteroides]UGT63635.1 TetR/AcrR family transcriptional regulator [Nocardia asteroides]
MTRDPIALPEPLGHATVPADPAAERILDAAVAETAAVGVERLRMEDVVRRSGLGRTTVYRRFPSRDELIRALVTRETQHFLAAVAAGMDQVDRPSDRVVEALLAAVSFAGEHPILRRLARTAPGSVVELAGNPGTEFLTTGAAFIARHLHGEGQGPPGREARWVADVFARLFLTYLALPPADPDMGSEAGLRAFARGVLTPMAERVTPASPADERGSEPRTDPEPS